MDPVSYKLFSSENSLQPGKIQGKNALLGNELRERRAETLRCKAPQLLKRVCWLDSLPADFHGVMLANELLDAMPVERFRVDANGVRQLHVAWE